MMKSSSSTLILGFGEVLEARLNRFKIRVKANVEMRPSVPGSNVADDDQRIAATWPKMGVEIIPGETIPAETGLAWVAVSFTKGCYPGRSSSSGWTVAARPHHGISRSSTGIRATHPARRCCRTESISARSRPSARRRCWPTSNVRTTARHGSDAWRRQRPWEKNLERMRNYALGLPETTRGADVGHQTSISVCARKIFASPRSTNGNSLKP